MQAQLIREQAARAEAEAANKAKDRFIAMLSHELRTPLTPILFASSILSQDPTVPDHIREELKIITRNVELEARLIDDLLDVTRISQGKLNLAFETADAHELLHSALRICSSEISAKKLTVQLELEAIEHRIRADSRPAAADLLESHSECRQVHAAGRSNHVAFEQSSKQLVSAGGHR